jgi:NAD(P)-dependent dehydrogenase (short-subunit alcohol dehydrogenase family)
MTGVNQPAIRFSPFLSGGEIAVKNLQGKRILVCGGATGIGASAVRRLCEEGARVGIGDLNDEGARALAADLCAAGADVTAWSFDQGSGESVSSLASNALEHFGGLDGLFANVADIGAVQQEGDLLTTDIDLWERTLRVNLVGTVHLVRAVLPVMLEQGGGAIVLTSSDAGTIGEPERPAYAASKAGVNTLARHVASKWGRKGIRCNAIAPGFVLTDQIQENMSPDMLDWMLKGARSPRHGAPEDIAGAVSFLLSDDGEWVNGQTWRVNGGVSYGL